MSKRKKMSERRGEEEKEREKEREGLKEFVSVGEHHGVKFYNVSPLLLNPQVFDILPFISSSFFFLWISFLTKCFIFAQALKKSCDLIVEWAKTLPHPPTKVWKERGHKILVRRKRFL